MNYFVLWFIATVAVSLGFFDAVLNLQHRDHREQWRKDGCPWGFFSFARETGFLAGCQARNRVFAQWLRRTPVWAIGDRAAARYLYLFRLTGALSLVIWTVAALSLLKLV